MDDHTLYTRTDNSNDLYHSLANKYMSLNGYPCLEVYLWGNELRTQFVNYLEALISCLEEAKSEIIESNEYVTIMHEQINYVDNANSIIAIFINNKKVAFFSMVLSFFLIELSNYFVPSSTNDIDELIDLYENMCYAFSSSNSSSEDKILYSIPIKAKVDCKFEQGRYCYYLNHIIDTTGIKYVNYYKYSNEYVYDIKLFDHNNDGSYMNIYGKIHTSNAYQILDEYLD